MSLLPDLRHHFRRFIEAAPQRIHAAAHSHHYWPDVTYQAQLQCWEDAARLADAKWERIFGEVLPAVQEGVAEVLALPEPRSLAFAPNTHDFVRRLLSCLPADRVPRVLSSDGEFHSFARQVARLEEDGLLQVTRVPVSPVEDLAARFAEAVRGGGFDLLFVSHVFFDSGLALADLNALVGEVADADALVVIDGYHAFLARPVDLGGIAERAFYLGGGYKYAMAGEGCCFLHCPFGQAPRPRDTGWYAAFDALAAGDAGVPYPADGGRFLGATFDPVGLYRMRAVLEWLRELAIGAADIHDHVRTLQARFVDGLASLDRADLHPEQLLLGPDWPDRGNFLAFRTPQARFLQEALAAVDVVVDHRGDRLRVGFGLYHRPEDVDALLERLAGVLRR